MPQMESSGSRGITREWVLVVACGALALLAFAAIGEDVFHHDTNTFDGAVRAWVLAHRSQPAVTFFDWVSTFGSVTPLAGLAIIGALVLWRAGRRHVVSAALLAPAGAVTTYYFVKPLFERKRPSLIGLLEGTSSFPSAHSTTSAAIAVTLAYVFWREGEVSGATAATFGTAVPLLVGVSRVYLDMHWATDVLGGWCAGIVVAALSAGLYEQTRHLWPSSYPAPLGA